MFLSMFLIHLLFLAFFLHLNPNKIMEVTLFCLLNHLVPAYVFFVEAVIFPSTCYRPDVSPQGRNHNAKSDITKVP